MEASSDNEDNNSMVSNSALEVSTSKKRKEVDSPVSTEKKISKRIKGIDEQAEESGDSEESGDESGDEEDESNYVYNDFLVRDDQSSSDEDENGAGSKKLSEAKARKKRDLKSLKKRRGEVQLDEEDLQLVRDYEASRAKKSQVSKMWVVIPLDIRTSLPLLLFCLV